MILIPVYLLVSCACLLCIYIDHCIFADVDIVTSSNKCLTDYQTSLCRQKCSSSLASCEGAGAWSSLSEECDSG